MADVSEDIKKDLLLGGFAAPLANVSKKAPLLQVVEWVLGPIRAAWTSQDWLCHLASADAFYARFINITAAADGRAEVYTQSCISTSRLQEHNIRLTCQAEQQSATNERLMLAGEQ